MEPAKHIEDAAKILIVEDDPGLVVSVRLLLEDEGFHLVGVTDEALDALRLAKNDPPDIALVDVSIRGDIDGLTIARQLQQEYGTRIIFTTGQPTRVIWAFEDLHSVGILSKPYGAKALLEIIEQTLSDTDAGGVATGTRTA